MKPTRIGIGMNYRLTESNVERAYLDALYMDAIRVVGAVLIPIAPTENARELEAVLDQVDGVFFTGGLDLDSALWHEPLHEKSQKVHPVRQRFDFLLYRLTTQRRLPIFAVCLGLQMINVAHGGSLCQHLPERALSVRVDHGGEAHLTTHSVTVNPDSRLYQWLQTDRITVNSTHHQGVIHVGDGLIAAATADDGVVEAVERPDYPFLLAVQWHPERDMNNLVNQMILSRFLQSAVGKYDKD